MDGKLELPLVSGLARDRTGETARGSGLPVSCPGRYQILQSVMQGAEEVGLSRDWVPRWPGLRVLVCKTRALSVYD